MNSHEEIMTRLKAFFKANHSEPFAKDFTQPCYCPGCDLMRIKQLIHTLMNPRPAEKHNAAFTEHNIFDAMVAKMQRLNIEHQTMKQTEVRQQRIIDNLIAENQELLKQIEAKELKPGDDATLVAELRRMAGKQIGARSYVMLQAADRIEQIVNHG